MGRIHLLDPQTVEQIRAGEVIERPASVVKELVENAIDAGARTINVRITGGGINEIVVQDDGEGISAEDALLAVQRHATSKLANSADLFALTTLGFRGEALASIAAVSHLELLSRVPDAVEGVRLKVVGGALSENAPAAAPPGTTVTVRHLFFNTPPRRAFLKSLTAEATQVEEVLVGLALSRPQIRFIFTWEQRVVFDALPQDTLLERVPEVLGKDWVQGLIPLLDADATQTDDGIGITGLISSPDRHRNTRTAQYLFVNGRLVKSQPVSFALSRGYGELLPVGRFPFSIISLTLPPQVVDVNVHPTKREVKFQDERAVLHVLVQRVRRTLDQANLFKTVSLPAAGDDASAVDLADYPARRSADPTDSEPVLRLVSKSPPSTAQPALWRRPEGAEFRVLGQSHELFVLVEVEGELWVIDQHAAHERVIYEQVLATLHSEKGESQRLLLPLTFELPTAAHATLEEVQEHLGTLGFDIQPFGGNTYQVQATPPYFRPTDTPDLIIELAQVRSENRMDNPIEAKLEDLAARIACKVKSVKAGQTLTPEAMRALVIALLASQSPFVCPHGRPTMVRLPVQQLAAQFDRR